MLKKNQDLKPKLVVICAFPTKAESKLLVSIADSGERIPKKPIPIYFEELYTEKFLKDFNFALREKKLRIVRLLFPYFIQKKSVDLVKILFRFLWQQNDVKFIFLKPNPAELFISYYNNYLIHNKADKEGYMLNPTKLAEHFTKNEMLDSIRNFALIYSRIKHMSRCFDPKNLHGAYNEIMEFLNGKSFRKKTETDFEIQDPFAYLEENLLHPIFNNYILGLDFFSQSSQKREEIVKELMEIQSKYKINKNLLEDCPKILDENAGEFISKISSIVNNMIDDHHSNQNNSIKSQSIKSNTGKIGTMIYST